MTPSPERIPRRAALGALLALAGGALLGDGPRVGVLVMHDVGCIRQPSPYSCWAAVFAMMLGWRERSCLEMAPAVASLGEPWNGYFERDTGLPGGSEARFAEAAGLQTEGPAGYPLESWLRMLEDYGPLWVTVGDGHHAHARLIVGAVGDGSPDGSSFVIADPADGLATPIPFMTFYRQYVAEIEYFLKRNMLVDLRLQIMHWPAPTLLPIEWRAAPGRGRGPRAGLQAD